MEERLETVELEPRGRKEINHFMVGVRVRGVEDEHGKEEYYYGEVHEVRTTEGYKRYHVSWDEEKYLPGDYSWTEIQSLKFKGDHEPKHEGDEVQEVDPSTTAVDDDTCGVRACGEESEPYTFGFDHDEYQMGGFAVVRTGDFKRDDCGNVTLSSRGRETRGVGPVMRMRIEDEGTQEEEIDDEDVGDQDWELRASAILTKGLSDGTVSTYGSGMNAFKEYLMMQGFGLQRCKKRLSWDPLRDNFITKSNEAQQLFMGFVVYCVEEKRVKVSTAAQYKTNVKSMLHTASGIDVTYNQDWGLMRKLLGRLSEMYPQKKKTRLPLLQQHLLQIRRVLDLYDDGHRSDANLRRQAKQQLDITIPCAKRLIAILERDGTILVWVALTTYFFTVSRGKDLSPKTRCGFDATTDTTVSDVEWTDYGYALKIKKTKTGHNLNFDAKPVVEVMGNALCPVTAMKNHLRQCLVHNKDLGSNMTTTPLFQRKDGSVLTTRDLYEYVKNCMKCIGLNERDYGAHSLRIGGATAALASAGGNEYVVKVLGYWVSNAVESYTKPTKEMVMNLVKDMIRSRSTAMLE